MKKISLFDISLVVIFIVLFLGNNGWCDLSRGKIKKGIKAFEKSQWDESLQNFQDALLDEPEHPVGHFNVGEAYYKKKNYEEALKSYEKALSSQDPKLKQKTYYNLGNTYYQLNKYQEAIQSYIKALDLDPADQDAKHNLEFVRAKLKELAQKQPMQNQPQPQQGSQSQNSQEQNQQNSEQQQNQQQQQQQAQAGDQKKNESEQQSEQEQAVQQAEQKKDLSKEEAERILQALKSEEQENQKLRRQRVPGGKMQVEKDW